VSGYPLRFFGDPVLRQPAREVEELDGNVALLVAGMLETMREAAGLGLAAPQVGVRKRVFTYDMDDGPHAVINPEIVDSSGEWAYEEGCLSLPGFHFTIVRPKIVTMRGVDLEGREVLIEADELMARMIQHEIDHLDGRLLLERADPEARREVLREIRTRGIDANAASARTADARRL
jgi:peptide deformylase